MATTSITPNRRRSRRGNVSQGKATAISPAQASNLPRFIEAGVAQFRYDPKAEKREAVPLGLTFRSGLSLDALVSVAKEIEATASIAEVSAKFALGDVFLAIDARPGTTKRLEIDRAFGDGAYDRLRKLGHVAKAFEATTFSDGSVRRRTGVAWSVYQDLAANWVPDDLRRELLTESAAGRLTISGLRQILKPLRPGEQHSSDRVIQKGAPESDAGYNPMKQSAARDLLVPALDPTFYVAPAVNSNLEREQRMSEDGHIRKIFICGPKGVGKTELVEWFCATHQRLLFTFLCAKVRTGKDWFGIRASRGGDTTFLSTGLIEALETPNAVILLDELNRTDNENHNVLFDLLDGRKETRITEMIEVRASATARVAPGVTVFFTANIGNEYGGTREMDPAFIDRICDRVLLPTPPSDEVKRGILTKRRGCTPEQAQILLAVEKKLNVDLYEQARVLPWRVGMRQLLSAALDLRYGASIADAIEGALLNQMLAFAADAEQVQLQIRMKVNEAAESVTRSSPRFTSK